MYAEGGAQHIRLLDSCFFLFGITVHSLHPVKCTSRRAPSEGSDRDVSLSVFKFGLMAFTRLPIYRQQVLYPWTQSFPTRLLPFLSLLLHRIPSYAPARTVNMSFGQDSAFYKPNLHEVEPETLRLFETYSKIPANQVVQHIETIVCPMFF